MIDGTRQGKDICGHSRLLIGILSLHRIKRFHSERVGLLCTAMFLFYAHG